MGVKYVLPIVHVSIFSTLPLSQTWLLLSLTADMTPENATLSNRIPVVPVPGSELGGVVRIAVSVSKKAASCNNREPVFFDVPSSPSRLIPTVEEAIWISCHV